MNGALIWSLSIYGNEMASEGKTMKQMMTNKWKWKLLCCQRNSFKRWWNLRFLREKCCILILMMRYALQRNLTRAVNSPVAFKSSFTSAVVRSFSVLTFSILVTLVCSLAFVNVWNKKKSGILDVKFASLMPMRCWKVMAEKLTVDRHWSHAQNHIIRSGRCQVSMDSCFVYF